VEQAAKGAHALAALAPEADERGARPLEEGSAADASEAAARGAENGGADGEGGGGHGSGGSPAVAFTPPLEAPGSGHNTLVVRHERESHPPAWLRALRGLRLASPAPPRTPSSKSPKSRDSKSPLASESGRAEPQKVPRGGKAANGKVADSKAKSKTDRHRGDNRAARGRSSKSNSMNGGASGSSGVGTGQTDSERDEDLEVALRALELERLKEIERIEIEVSQRKKLLREEARRQVSLTGSTSTESLQIRW